MPSTNKTAFLGLNKWLGSDKPKMEDFNSDNQKIDNAIKAHQEDPNLHLTPQQKDWVATPFILGSYVGNGQEERMIELGFTPRFLVVLGHEMSPFEYSAYMVHTNQFMAVACGDGFTLGISLAEGGFVVYLNKAGPSDGTTSVQMNVTGVTYHYFAVR